MRHLRERPTVLKRWVDGVQGEPFFQKRVPDSAPEWLQTATVTFPSGRHARELVPNDAAHLVWGVNLGVIDWNPWPVRRSDLDHPDELRVDLDPGPDVAFAAGPRASRSACARCSRSTASRGFPKTSGSRGMHVLRAHRSPSTASPRCAAPRSRSPARSSGGCQAKRPPAGGRRSARASSSTTTRTPATAPSPRRTRCARCPTRASRARWSGRRSPTSSPAELRIDTVPARLRERGDPSADIDEHAGSLASLLELAARDEREGLGDAPWPPHFRKQNGRAAPRPTQSGQAAMRRPCASASAGADADRGAPAEPPGRG